MRLIFHDAYELCSIRPTHVWARRVASGAAGRDIAVVIDTRLSRDTLLGIGVGVEYIGKHVAVVTWVSYSGIANELCAVSSMLLDLAMLIVLHVVMPNCTVRRLAFALHVTMRRRTAMLHIMSFNAHALVAGHCA